MYPIVLTIHSLLRWVVVALAVWGLVRAVTAKDAPWTSADETPRRWLPHAFTLQLVLGLWLYGGLSPITAMAMGNMKAAMKDPALRFWAVEHFSVMLVALAFVHIGGARARRAETPAAKRSAMQTFFGLAFLLVLAGTPWAARPLLRLGTAPEAPAAPATPPTP